VRGSARDCLWVAGRAHVECEHGERAGARFGCEHGERRSRAAQQVGRRAGVHGRWPGGRNRGLGGQGAAHALPGNSFWCVSR
jgi:hypothetical protein